MTTKEKIEVMQAWIDQKPIQVGGIKKWYDLSFLGDPAWNWEANEYRIKPLAAKRLIRADELPPIVWVRKAACGDRWHLVDQIAGPCLHVTSLQETKESPICLTPGAMSAMVFEWSPDRLSVKSFYIEEETK